MYIRASRCSEREFHFLQTAIYVLNGGDDEPLSLRMEYFRATLKWSVFLALLS
jgi:hypothetical protein